jgi:hypothetical protein
LIGLSLLRNAFSELNIRFIMSVNSGHIILVITLLSVMVNKFVIFYSHFRFFALLVKAHASFVELLGVLGSAGSLFVLWFFLQLDWKHLDHFLIFFPRCFLLSWVVLVSDWIGLIASGFFGRVGCQGKIGLPHLISVIVFSVKYHRGRYWCYPTWVLVEFFFSERR